MTVMKIFRIDALSKLLSRLCVIIFFFAPFLMRAQGMVVIGDCNGEVAASSSIGVNYGSEGIEVASLFPASMFEKYDDLQALGINVGLANRLNVSKIIVWVRESLDGDNIFEASLSKEDGIKKGWNKVMSDATSLPEGKDLYVGYSLILSGASYPVSAVGESREHGFLRKYGEEWKDMAEQGYGVLSIELIATASNLVAYDLMLKQVSLPETIKIGSTVPMTLKVLNLGVETVRGFRLECSIENYNTIIYDVEQDIISNEYADIELEFIAPMKEKNSEVMMNVCITDIKDGKDADFSNNAMTVGFSVNRFDFIKRLLIEEFSTERCTFCPRAASSLHELLGEPEFEDRICAIVHHVGYNTDWLTIPVSNNYLWFYSGGAGGVYAPAFMYDRFSFDDSSPVSNGTDDYSSIKQKVSERLSVIPMTALEAWADFDSTASRLNIHVEGERRTGFEGNRLTICVVENNIPARNQAGVTDQFIHQHVARDINEIWGYEIDWDSDSFFHDTSIYFNPSWTKENIDVIAFISNYDPTNYKNCTVDNAVASSINWGESGVDEIGFEEDADEPEYFSLSGLRVKNPEGGLYIVKRGNKVTKEFVGQEKIFD